MLPALGWSSASAPTLSVISLRTVRAKIVKFSRILAVTLLLPYAGCSKSEESAGKRLFAAPSLPEEEMLDEAMHAYDSGLFSVAKASWTNLKDGYPASYFLPLAELKAADSFFQVSDFIAAQTGYEEFARLHPGHEAMAYVRFQLGNCSMQQYQGAKYDQSPLTQAIKLFQTVIDDYPSSEYTVLARRKISEAREMLAMHESYVAGFYLNQGKVDASAARLARLGTDYPESAAAKNARQLLTAEFPGEMVAVDAKVAADSGTEIARLPKKEPKSPRLIERSEIAVAPVSIDSASLTPSIRESEIAGATDSTRNNSTAANDKGGIAVFGVTCESQAGLDTFTISLAKPLRITGTEERTPTTLVSSYVTGDDSAKDARSQNSAPTQSKDYSCELNANRTAVRETVSAAGVTTVELSINHQQKFTPVIFSLDRPERIFVVLRPTPVSTDQG